MNSDFYFNSKVHKSKWREQQDGGGVEWNKHGADLWLGEQRSRDINSGQQGEQLTGSEWTRRLQTSPRKARITTSTAYDIIVFRRDHENYQKVRGAEFIRKWAGLARREWIHSSGTWQKHV